MEKVCEFCMALRPAVYCQADSALLCLSCDLKVHSANALSNRHLRSPLCDSCQACPASVRCNDHRMHMCRTCDRSLHRSSSTSSHKNRAIGSYTGCPSAKDLAALWDLDLGDLGDAPGSSLIVSSQEFVDFGNLGLDAMSCTKSVRGRMPDEGMNNQQLNKISHKGQQQQQQQQQSRSSLVIVQQILDLQRLQLNEGNCYSSIMRCEEKRDTSSSSGNLRRIYEAGHENSQHSRDLEAEFLKGVTPLEELGSEGFSSPFSSLENLSTLTAGISLLGDSFWQCRSPLQTGQFMSQNVQDLGLFEDLSCRNIPDVDMTFKSFEELFGGDQDPAAGLLTSDNDLSCSSVDREISLDKSENSRAPDASTSSSTYLDSITHLNSDTSRLNRVGCPLQPSYSEVSFSISQVTEGASGSPDFGAAVAETKPNVMTRYRDKKKARLDGEKIRLELPKDEINVRKRVKGRQLGRSGRNPDDMSARSF